MHTDDENWRQKWGIDLRQRIVARVSGPDVFQAHVSCA